MEREERRKEERKTEGMKTGAERTLEAISNRGNENVSECSIRFGKNELKKVRGKLINVIKMRR